MIVVAGEALIDMVADVPVVGGSPANVAVTLARQEQPVRLLARLATDPYGQQIRAYLSANDVDLSWAVPAAEPTSLAIATTDATGSASYEFHLDGTADWQWRPDELPDRLGPPVIALHTGSLALAMPPGAARLEDFLAGVRASGAVTISIDLNLRPSIRPDRDAERARIERQIRFAHIVKASEEDLAWLYPDEPIERVAAAWSATGVACCVVTLGADGAYLVAPDGFAYRSTARRVTVVDTVGAGDAFTGAMLGALARIEALGSDPVARLDAVKPPQWRSVLDDAGTVAAITCTRRGANPPSLAELAAIG
jgi:fructokinase